MITSEISKAGPFTGDGETLVFDFSFTALDADHVAVYVDGVKVTTGFTVELLTGGGRVTFEAAPAIDAPVAIIRDVPAKQEMDLQNNTAFLPEVIETAFDRLTMMIQQLRDLFSRTPVAPPTEDTTSEELYSRFTGAMDTLEAYVAAVDGTVDTKIMTHDDDALAHGAIRAKIGTDIGVHNSAVDAHADIRMALGDGVAAGVSTHNGNASAHTAIQTKIGTDISTHSSSGSAHSDIRTNIGLAVHTHNSSSASHEYILAKIRYDIDAHNSAENAHLSSIASAIHNHEVDEDAHNIYALLSNAVDNLNYPLTDTYGPIFKSFVKDAVGGRITMGTSSSVQYILGYARVTGKVFLCCTTNIILGGVTFYAGKYYDALVSQGAYYTPAVLLRGTDTFFVPSLLYIVNPINGAPLSLSNPSPNWRVAMLLMYSPDTYDPPL